MSIRTAVVATIATVALLAPGHVGWAEEFPEEVSASKCRGKKKIFGFIDDPTSTPTVRKVKMRNSFYIQSGSIFVQGCKTFEGDSDECQESFGLGILLSPGFTGEIPCNSQSGLPYINYSLSSDDGSESTYWSNTANCTVTITKYDAERGRLKGTYRTELISGAAYADLVGCFSARGQPLD